jgi:hypothetical protein
VLDGSISGSFGGSKSLGGLPAVLETWEVLGKSWEVFGGFRSNLESSWISVESRTGSLAGLGASLG